MNSWPSRGRSFCILGRTYSSSTCFCCCGTTRYTSDWNLPMPEKRRTSDVNPFVKRRLQSNAAIALSLTVTSAPSCRMPPGINSSLLVLLLPRAAPLDVALRVSRTSKAPSSMVSISSEISRFRQRDTISFNGYPLLMRCSKVLVSGAELL